MDRAQLRTPLVVETGGDPAAVEILAPGPQYDVVDPRGPPTYGWMGPTVTVEVVDLPVMERARGLRAVRGDLGDLGPDAVAVTETYAFDQAVGVGDRVRMEIDGGPRPAERGGRGPGRARPVRRVLVSAAMVVERARDAVPELVFVDPAEAPTYERCSRTRTRRVLTADSWIDEVEEQTRAGNNLGLWVLLGPAGLYAGIAIVNAVLIGASQRRTQLRTIGLLGATDTQRRRMALWEAGLVGVAALLAGAVVTGYVGWLVASAIERDLGAVPMTVPWLPLLGVLLVCLGLALLAALVGSRRPRGS